MALHLAESQHVIIGDMIASEVPFKAKQIANVAGCSRRTINMFAYFSTVLLLWPDCCTKMLEIRFCILILSAQSADLSRYLVLSNNFLQT